MAAMITAQAALHAPSLPPEPALRRHLAEVEDLGYTVIPGFLDRGTTATLRAYVDSVLPAPVPADQPAAVRRHAIRHPMTNAGFMAGMISDELLELATALLDARDLRLLSQNFCRTDPMPGPPCPHGYHVDRVMFPRHRTARPRQTYYHFFQALSDVRSGGGAFMIIPGSHQATWATAERFDGRAMKDYWQLGAEVRAAAGIDESTGIEVLVNDGDLVVFDPMCVHAPSANTRPEPRYILNQILYDASAADLTALWVDCGDRWPIPDEMRAALPERHRHLLLP
jgi:hypothetical protein